jgi:hypothetical protein
MFALAKSRVGQRKAKIRPDCLLRPPCSFRGGRPHGIPVSNGSKRPKTTSMPRQNYRDWAARPQRSGDGVLPSVCRMQSTPKSIEGWPASGWVRSIAESFALRLTDAVLWPQNQPIRAESGTDRNRSAGGPESPHFATLALRCCAGRDASGESLGCGGRGLQPSRSW